MIKRRRTMATANCFRQAGLSVIIHLKIPQISFEFGAAASEAMYRMKGVRSGLFLLEAATVACTKTYETSSEGSGASRAACGSQGFAYCCFKAS